jgi:outer membrane assembly lipoprotein YfiO
MNRRWIKFFLPFAIFILAFPLSASAAWVWTPQTGWIGPSGAVKDTPEEQLLYAKGFFEAPDYPSARREFEKLLKSYKDSPQAPEAQYYLGRCYEEERDYYAAFLAYRKGIQIYPSTERFNEILERMYQMGNYFLSGKKRKIFGKFAILPARDKAVEIFEGIIEDGPFSQYGELSQYKLGIAHLALGEYEQAVTAFEQLVDRYPESKLVDDARFQIAQASLKGTFRAGYDQHPTDQAIKQLDIFVQEYSSSDLLDEARKRIDSLKEQRAEHEFKVAQFYEKRKRPESALVYYDGIASKYATTSWAAISLSRANEIRAILP